MVLSELLLFGCLVIVMLVSAGSIVYSTIRLGIPPMPSSKKAYLAMIQLVEKTGTDTIVDFGSGWGSLVIRLAKKYPQRKVIGYELSLLPWVVSCLIKKTLGLKNLTIRRQDFFKADLSNVSVIICYLFPEAMEKLSNKILKDNTAVNFIISNNFAFPAVPPSKTIRLNDFYQSNVYLYTMKESS